MTERESPFRKVAGNILEAKFWSGKRDLQQTMAEAIELAARVTRDMTFEHANPGEAALRDGILYVPMDSELAAAMEQELKK